MGSFADINAIANNATFQGRCLYALEVAAISVLSEDSKTPQHGSRVIYARTVINGQISGYLVALAVLSNPTIAQESDATQVSTTAGVPDGDIQFTVNSVFNALAGIGS